MKYFAVIFLLSFLIGCSHMSQMDFERDDGATYSMVTLDRDKNDCHLQFPKNRLAYKDCMVNRGWKEIKPSSDGISYESFDPGK
jgi:hypothetical protein